jgi:glycosyltransferase involved in cell wall biosynthesis
MKVLMFGWEFPPHISGGLGTACYGLTKGLVKVGGIDIDFIIPKKFGDEYLKHVEIKGANTIEINQRVIVLKEILEEVKLTEIEAYLTPYCTPEEYLKERKKREKHKTQENKNKKGKYNFKGGYGTNLFQEIANYSLVAMELAKQRSFDIIHSHDWLTYPAGIAAKKISKKPFVIHVHATEFDRSGNNINQSVYNIEKAGMLNADKIIAVSDLTRNIIINNYGIAPEKIVTVHNAVEPLKNELAVKNNIDAKIVTFLGRITHQKGPGYFIEAANKVLQKDSNVHFVMAGSGDLLNSMIMYTAKLKIGHKFHFTGFLKGDDVKRMFALSDVYVMPSVSEPFGISPLEAMHSNVPVIISKQSGVSEILKYAIKIDYWDIDSIADSIYGIINYKGIQDMCNKHSREEVNNLKWENAARKVKKLYETILL